MRKLIFLAIAVLLCSLAATAETRYRQAPEINLPYAASNEPFAWKSVVGYRPILVWFPEAHTLSERAARPLIRIASENNAELLIIPVIGVDADQACLASAMLPEQKVLVDLNGQLTVQYTGEYIAGMSPRKNLYLVSSLGQITWSAFWPGVVFSNVERAIHSAL